MGATGCDWFVASGQSKLLRPALYLAMNALSHVSSQSCAFNLLFSLCPFRERVNRKRGLWSSIGEKENGTFYLMDIYGGCMSVGKWEKRALERRGEMEEIVMKCTASTLVSSTCYLPCTETRAHTCC